MSADRPFFAFRARAAGTWLARQDRGFTAEEAQAYARWRADDPRNAAAFDRLASDWIHLDQAKQVPELVAAARLIDVRARRPAARRTVGPWLSLGALIATAAVAVGFWWIQTRPSAAPAATYRVVPEVSQRQELADGSVVELNGDSQVQTEFTPEIRRIVLLKGEAHFTVAKNPRRPFIVVVGNAAVRAVGTAFDIRMTPAAVQVLVTEGKVNIESPAAASSGQTAPDAHPLASGQRALISATALSPASPAVEIDVPSRAQIEGIMAWKTTWLVFNNTPLEDAVQAFNRYGYRQLALDPALRGRRFGGKFRSDGAESFAGLLARGSGITLETRGDTLWLRPAR